MIYRSQIIDIINALYFDCNQIFSKNKPKLIESLTILTLTHEVGFKAMSNFLNLKGRRQTKDNTKYDID